MSFEQYQRACKVDPQPLEFNNINIRRTVPFRKNMDPLDYKYRCTSQPIQLVKKKKVVEHFDFANDTVDYKPMPCMFSVSGSYICIK